VRAEVENRAAELIAPRTTAVAREMTLDDETEPAESALAA
jgi:hypothetical protein